MNQVIDKRKLPKLCQDDSYLEPFAGAIEHRMRRARRYETLLLKDSKDLSSFATGYLYFGLHQTKSGWVFREWAPNATNIWFTGNFCEWKREEKFRMKKLNDFGVWVLEMPKDAIKHLDYYRLSVEWSGGSGERIPSYANYVVQDAQTHIFNARVWAPEKKYEFKNSLPNQKGAAPIIYEAHVGMAQIEGKVSSYDEFRIHTLPRIKNGGYNTVQLMAIQEHPYYGSFGYQVSNFFAASSRFGTPCELKQLIDEAHGMGLRVIMDIVHSHAVKNEIEGLGKFDGTGHQYFHDGGRGYHSAWDTRCFDYGKPQVTHFLLSNCKYWLDEYQFDGYRFDGVTSMLYLHHGHGAGFGSYGDYFNNQVDEDALVFFSLANKLIHEVKPGAITIAEDVSGMPGLAAPLSSGGIGFDFRLGMGIPDYWIRTLKHTRDEDWSVDGIWHELTNRRKDEKIISYAESHDQALVGDKTLIFWLADADMYWNMAVDRRNLVIDRAIALHKMIRFVTIACARGGYLNFIGNEFGHPEWVDFPREGNGWSYHYARRQWNLRDDQNLCYRFLAEFDKAMLDVIKENDILNCPDPNKFWSHCDDHVLGIERNGIYFVFNFDPTRSYPDYKFTLPQGKYQEIMNSDEQRFGGQGRLADPKQFHETLKDKLSLYLPTRTVIVFKKI